MITFLYARRSARLWACGAVATVSFALFLHLLPTWGVALSGRQEKLGTLFQQTARFVRDYPLFRVAHSWSPDMPNLFHLQAVFPNVPCGMSALASLPLIGWVADMGFYVPLFLFVFFWALWKRDRAALLVAQPCLWAVAVLWVASANGEFRYVLPILSNLPLFAALIFSKRTA